MDILKIAELASQSIKQKFPEQIAIIALYGSGALGTAHDLSDIDMYAIIDNKDMVDKVAIHLLFENNPVDLWSMIWDDAEKMASGKNEFSEMWAVAASLFVNNRVLYYRSDEDLERFKKLSLAVEKTQKDDLGNLKLTIESFNRQWGIERIKSAKFRNDILFTRWYVWNFINHICIWLSRLNNAYYSKNWGSNLAQVFKLPLIPHNLQERLEILCTSKDYDQIYAIIEEIKSDLRSLIYTKQQNTKGRLKNIDLFEAVNMIEYINKVRAGCQKKDIFLVSYAATELQVWIMKSLNHSDGALAEDFNFTEEIEQKYFDMGFPELSDLISEKNYEGIMNKIEVFETILISWFEKIGLQIPKFSDMDGLKEYFDPKFNSENS